MAQSDPSTEARCERLMLPGSNGSAGQHFPPINKNDLGHSVPILWWNYFVVELMSPSDTLSVIQAKLHEYIANGARLGWLFNRWAKQVELYRSHQPVELLEAPATLLGEDVLPGLVLQVASCIKLHQYDNGVITNKLFVSRFFTCASR
jgi:hypothetical protein